MGSRAGRTNDRPPSGVHADPLESAREVGHVRREQRRERGRGVAPRAARRRQGARAKRRLSRRRLRWRLRLRRRCRGLRRLLRGRRAGRRGRATLVPRAPREEPARERARHAADAGGQLAAEGAAGDEVDHELELLGDGEDERAERRDVRLERVAGDLHDLLREAHAADPRRVLFLVHRAVRLVILADVRAHSVQQLEARAPPVGGAVGEEDGGGAAAEEAVGEQHGALVACGSGAGG